MKLKAKELGIRTVLQLTVLLHQVFVAAQGIFSSCGEWATLCHGAWTSQGGDFSCCRAQALESVGLSSCGTWARQLCIRAQLPRGMWTLPDPGLNLCPLHWQVNSYPLCHQGSSLLTILKPFYEYTRIGQLCKWMAHSRNQVSHSRSKNYR